MTDGANYVGRRVVVVTDDGSAHIEPILVPLVEAGAEVHLIGAELPRPVAGLASRTACDATSIDALDAAMARVGAVVEYVFHCVTGPDAGAAFSGLALAARPLMVLGGAVVAVRATVDAAEPFVREQSADFAEDGIRLTVATPAGALRSGLA